MKYRFLASRPLRLRRYDLKVKQSGSKTSQKLSALSGFARLYDLYKATCAAITYTVTQSQHGDKDNKKLRVTVAPREKC